MSLWNRLAAMLTPSSTPQSLYERGLKLAKKGKLDAAIESYSKVLRIDNAPVDIRAMSHLNRALAHSSKRENGPAREDLEAVIAMRDAPEEVRKTAEEKLTKLKRRLGIKDE